MAAPAARHQWIVDLLDLSPGLHVLELGSGPGVAASFVLDRLGAEGRYVGLDRSEKMTAAGTKRNAAHVEGGTAHFVCSTIGDAAASLGGRHFDRVFASNVVALIDERAPEHLVVVRDLLADGGQVLIAMQLFDQDDAARMGDAAASALTDAGFEVLSIETPPEGLAGDVPGPGMAVRAHVAGDTEAS